MENVALQCGKLVAEAAADSWTKEQSDALKEQVVSLAREDHPVRKIASKSGVLRPTKLGERGCVRFQ